MAWGAALLRLKIVRANPRRHGRMVCSCAESSHWTAGLPYCSCARSGWLAMSHAPTLCSVGSKVAVCAHTHCCRHRTATLKRRRWCSVFATFLPQATTLAAASNAVQSFVPPMGLNYLVASWPIIPPTAAPTPVQAKPPHSTLPTTPPTTAPVAVPFS